MDRLQSRRQDQTRSGNGRAHQRRPTDLSNTEPCSGQGGFPQKKRGIGDASVGGAKGDWPAVNRGVNGLSWRLTACIQVTLSKCECRYMQHPYVRAFQSSLVLAMLLLLKGWLCG
jgi:hypothetical protein